MTTAHSTARPNARARFMDLEAEAAEQEVRLGAWPIVAIESVAVVQPDVAQHRDLHSQTRPGAHLQVRWADLPPQVPGVAGIEEEHTVQRMDNGKLLLKCVQGHEPSA